MDAAHQHEQAVRPRQAKQLPRQQRLTGRGCPRLRPGSAPAGAAPAEEMAEQCRELSELVGRPAVTCGQRHETCRDVLAGHWVARAGVARTAELTHVSTAQHSTAQRSTESAPRARCPPPAAVPSASPAAWPGPRLADPPESPVWPMLNKAGSAGSRRAMCTQPCQVCQVDTCVRLYIMRNQQAVCYCAPASISPPQSGARTACAACWH